MARFKKAVWFLLGMIFLGIAYIGIVTPGIPWSTPTVLAAYCFGKSSRRWHEFLMQHELFGPFLRNWSEKRIFPGAGKWAMVVTMDISLIIIWFTTYNWKIVMATGSLMLLCGIWAWRYPSSLEEFNKRQSLGQKIGWLK